MTRKLKNTLNGSNRKVYITSAVGILAIAGLIYAGVALNEEPNLNIEVPPSPTSMLFPSQSVIGKEPTKAPTGGQSQRPTPTVKQTTPGGTTPKPTAAAPTKGAAATPVPTKGAEDSKETQQVSAEALAALSFSGEQVLNWPVLGEVILGYSMDHTVYHETLNLFKTSDGVLLAAEKGVNVVSAADGIVTDITEDTMHGVCVTMAIGSGYEVIYGQLEETELKIGDSLKEGDVVGTIAEPTRYYSVEGPHLYLKMQKDDEPVNPMLYLRVSEEAEE